MFNLTEQCVLTKLDETVIEYCEPFSCGDEDLDDFFAHHAVAYDKELLGKTYCWVLKESPSKIMGMFTVANAGIQTTHLQNNPKRKINKAIPYSKQGRTYPAVLIGRLGSTKEFQGSDYRIGSQMMMFIKEWFRSEDNKTGCRFILVDALNTPQTLAYYERQGFKPLFPRSEDEKDFYGISHEYNLRTRMYYFDLLTGK